ncbi:MAG: bifunctional DNA primase/polymerase, partial [Alphaproteobacteria bacterium]|nr:bifunctional DNA primase/polymerase [Alphaproteobacteria bacterium]
AGFWVRPIEPQTKRCFIKGWQRPDPELPPGTIEQRGRDYPCFGIALVMGSPLPDGTRLAALDVDCNEYVRVAKAILGDPPCGRFGSKGAVFFIRTTNGIKNRKFKVKEAKGKTGKSSQPIVELLSERCLCVIPPTIHPITKQPYSWLGPSLLEIDPTSLPLVTE